MSAFANSVKRTCAAVCPLYGDVPMGAPGPPGSKGPPGPPVSFPPLRRITPLQLWNSLNFARPWKQKHLDVVCFRHHS